MKLKGTQEKVPRPYNRKTVFTFRKALNPIDKIQFVNELPSRRVEKHLMRQFVKNTDLPKRNSDLNDWVYVGLAVSYCDVVLAEKQFTDLVNRKGLVKKAVVIFSLAELPRV